jgi:preprotein translocase subunit SecA
MFGKIITSFIGSSNDRELDRIAAIVDMVNNFEPAMQARTDAELRELTDLFKIRLADGETLDDILPEAFAAAREASVRALQMRPFDVQVVVGVVLHEGKIAEMKTGEGKTLAATMPLYLNALTGKGAHLVTVNDYLAKRDAEWMGQIFQFLGLTVGYIIHGIEDEHRRDAYNADITYGTNNEFGFDYLRDNLKMRSEQLTQRNYAFAIVDEVDSILIDEARTPLIISGPVPESQEDYQRVNAVVKFLKKGEHYTLDEKAHSASLTDEGVSVCEQRLALENLYDPDSSDVLHKVETLIKAYALYHRDKDYIVKGREVLLVDDFTGRLMPGRRLSDGLHQAIEAKENVQVHAESQTYASISFQNYFRMYKKLAGMTGTADTEAAEFKQIYKLDVVIIPTNKPMIREDNPDEVYAGTHEKIAAIAADIRDCYERGQPVLVGTTSIEKSEAISRVLKGGIIEKEFALPDPEEEEQEPEYEYDEEGKPIGVIPPKKKKKKKSKPSAVKSRWEPFNIPHNVLNARNHAQEAEIVAQAGRYSKITIATNMAGRGTDIQLGGNPESLAEGEAGTNATERQYMKALEKYTEICAEEKRQVLEAGGLHIIGTERHESRRIDNQLRGRSGRQGDPGASRFYLSLDDDLLRIFGQDKLKNIFAYLDVPEDEPLIAHRMADKLIERAQKQVEAHNFDIRKHLLEYDDVMNRQREVIYELRKELLTETDLSEQVKEMISEIASETALSHTDGKQHPELWPFAEMQEVLKTSYGFNIEYEEDRFYELTPEVLAEDVESSFFAHYENRTKRLGEPMMREAERFFLLQTVDSLWMNHLWAMDHLRDAVRFSGYAQKNPLIEYKKEAFSLFEQLMWKISEDTVRKLCRFEVSEPDEAKFQRKAKTRALNEKKEQAQAPADLRQARQQAQQGHNVDGQKQQPVRVTEKVKPNDPCPCGSGKKYKKCCRDKVKPA